MNESALANTELQSEDQYLDFVEKDGRFFIAAVNDEHVLAENGLLMEFTNDGRVFMQQNVHKDLGLQRVEERENEVAVYTNDGYQVLPEFIAKDHKRPKLEDEIELCVKESSHNDYQLELWAKQGENFISRLIIIDLRVQVIYFVEGVNPDLGFELDANGRLQAYSPYV